MDITKTKDLWFKSWMTIVLVDISLTCYWVTRLGFEHEFNPVLKYLLKNSNPILLVIYIVSLVILQSFFSKFVFRSKLGAWFCWMFVIPLSSIGIMSWLVSFGL